MPFHLITQVVYSDHQTDPSQGKIHLFILLTDEGDCWQKKHLNFSKMLTQQSTQEYFWWRTIDQTLFIVQMSYQLLQSPTDVAESKHLSLKLSLDVQIYQTKHLSFNVSGVNSQVCCYQEKHPPFYCQFFMSKSHYSEGCSCQSQTWLSFGFVKCFSPAHAKSAQVSKVTENYSIHEFHALLYYFIQKLCYWQTLLSAITKTNEQ